METQAVAGLLLNYDPAEKNAARLVSAACERSVQMFQTRWGLSMPSDCRVYVMTSWARFLYQSAPWPWKVYLTLTWPLVARRARSIWPYAGGWSLPFGSRQVVGVKPPRLMVASDGSIGEQFFLPNRDLNEKVITVTCHELVHAFTFHLKLPQWLNEGLATLAMEHYLRRRIVREDTLDCLRRSSFEKENAIKAQPQGLIPIYARGYWLTRYIEETRNDVLKDILSRRFRRQDLEVKIASTYGKDRRAFWSEIYGDVWAYFTSKQTDIWLQ